jgi:hypothetical protein
MKKITAAIIYLFATNSHTTQAMSLFNPHASCCEKTAVCVTIAAGVVYNLENQKKAEKKQLEAIQALQATQQQRDNEQAQNSNIRNRRTGVVDQQPR